MAPITLEVEFRGLCMHVVNRAAGTVGILMPDGRDKGSAVEFPDGEVGAHHVGYLRCRLADVLGDPSIPGEVIHLFDGEVLDFGLPADATPVAVQTIHLPDVDCFAPELQLPRGVFSDPLPETIVMRTVLGGGTLHSRAGLAHWDFQDPFGKPGLRCGGMFTDRVTWTREADIEGRLTLSFTNAHGTSTLGLAPADPAQPLRITIANFCATNPLQWGDLGTMGLRTERDDKDFRWFYRILQPRTGTYRDLLPGTRKLPVPKLERRGGMRTNPPGCEGCFITADF